MSSHTPGPYVKERMRLRPNARDRRCGFVINTAWEDDGKPPMSVRICDMRTNTAVGFSELEANANLFVAATDMLAALEAARDVLEVAKNYFPKSIRNRDKFALLNTLANAVEPAIAKAKGETP